MQWATAFYANHPIDGAMDARWSKNAKYFFYRKVPNFLMVIIVSRTSLISYKRISTEYRKFENMFLSF